MLRLDEQLAISQQTEESWKETVASTRALMDAGLANEAATSQMEAAYYSVQTSILDLKEQINQVENSLALLLAETPRRYERGKLADQQLPEDVAVGVPMQMLSNRPDVRAAERSLEQAFYVTNQARAAFYPSIVLSGSAGWTNSAGSMIVNPGKFLASAVGSLTTAVVQQRTDHGPIPHRQSTAGGSKPVFPAGFAECRQRSQRRFGRLPDKQGQDGLVRKANPISGKGLGKYLVTDGARYDHLSGSADCPSVLVECTVVANS